MAQIGSVWGHDTWGIDAWGANTWGDASPITPVTASGGVESAGGEVFGSAISRLRESGYWWNQPPAETGPARIHASGAVIRSVARSISGHAVRVNHRDLRGSVTSVHARSVNGASEIDRTPIFEEEAFILGLLLGGDS